MTYNQFTKKYLGRYVDYDGSFGAQCVDLMRQYSKEVHEFAPYIAIPTRGNAKDIFRNFRTNKYYTKILNAPTNMPKQGDIVFWGTYPFITGFAGHVAIVESADVRNLVVYQQNYPTGRPCNFRKFDYRGVMGWLSKN